MKSLEQFARQSNFRQPLLLDLLPVSLFLFVLAQEELPRSASFISFRVSEELPVGTVTVLLCHLFFQTKEIFTSHCTLGNFGILKDLHYIVVLQYQLQTSELSYSTACLQPLESMFNHLAIRTAPQTHQARHRLPYPSSAPRLQTPEANSQLES